ncbi:hypothetical protein BaRGS_00023703, partial [Batillaria attramentaria]
ITKYDVDLRKDCLESVHEAINATWSQNAHRQAGNVEDTVSIYYQINLLPLLGSGVFSSGPRQNQREIVVETRDWAEMIATAAAEGQEEKLCTLHAITSTCVTQTGCFFTHPKSQIHSMYF